MSQSNLAKTQICRDENMRCGVRDFADGVCVFNLATCLQSARRMDELSCDGRIAFWCGHVNRVFTKSKIRWFELPIFIEIFGVMLYVLLGLNVPSFWHPGWLLCLAGVVCAFVELAVFVTKKARLKTRKRAKPSKTNTKWKIKVLDGMGRLNRQIGNIKCRLCSLRRNYAKHDKG